MAVSYAVLHTEITTDPRGYGYAPLLASGNDDGLASLLNKVRDGTDGFPAITVKRTDIASNEVLEAIDSRDLAASPNAGLCSWFQSTTALVRMRLVNDDGTDTRILGNLRRLYTSDVQGSRTRLQALATRPGSRAEELFGSGTVLSNFDVGQAK